MKEGEREREKILRISHELKEGEEGALCFMYIRYMCMRVLYIKIYIYIQKFLVSADPSALFCLLFNSRNKNKKLVFYYNQMFMFFPLTDFIALAVCTRKLLRNLIKNLNRKLTFLLIPFPFFSLSSKNKIKNTKHEIYAFCYWLKEFTFKLFQNYYYVIKYM